MQVLRRRSNFDRFVHTHFRSQLFARLDCSGSLARNAKSLANFSCQLRADGVTDLAALAASSAALRA